MCALEDDEVELGAAPLGRRVVINYSSLQIKSDFSYVQIIHDDLRIQVLVSWKKCTFFNQLILD